MIKNPRYPIRNYLKDTYHYIRPYKRQFFWGVFFRFTSDVSRLYPAFAISQIVLILTQGYIGHEKDLVRIFVLWGIAYAYFTAVHNVAKYLGYQVAEKAALDFYKDTLNHTFRLDFAWQEKENSGNKMKRIDKGLDGINMTVRRIFDTLIEVVVNTIGIFIIFLTQVPGISLVLVTFITTYFVVGTYLLKRAIKQEQIVNKAEEDLSGITFEALNNIQTIKSLSIDSGVKRVVGNRISSLVSKITKRIYLYQSRNTILNTIEALFEYSLVAVIAYGVYVGRYEVSLLILFIGLFGRVSQSTRELTDVTQELALGKIWISRAIAILDTTPEIEDPEKLKNQYDYPNDWEVLNIKDVKFAYKNKNALNKISFKVKRGEKVGIVGLSGAGKSTLFKLLLDLYEDYDGEILFDGFPLRNIKRQSYIDNVAVVLQDTELFDMTLKENIEIAGVHNIPNKSDLLDEVITMAHLDEVVRGLPNGLNTLVGEKGVKLSGGQRQRVGIARALYRQPEILLLDEATSHLDAHSEKEIQKSLQEFMHKFTTIVIAHRLSTIKAMDKIVVLAGGKVAEEGSFDELLKIEGVFAKMWQDQKI